MTNLIFLLFFLPLSLFIYSISGFRFQKIWLIVFSILFLIICIPFSAPVIIILSCFTYLCGKFITYEKKSPIAQSIALIINTSLNILLLAFFHNTEKFGISSEKIVFPVGLSFFCIQSFMYLKSCSDENAVFNRTFSDSILYFIYFPKLILGPVLSFDHFIAILGKRKISYKNISDGFFMFISGFAQKIIIADMLFKFISSVINRDAAALSFALVWYTALAFFLYIYFIFSSYSKMAEGISLCFGIRLPKNNYPYLLSDAVTHLSKKWNVTVVRFFENIILKNHQKSDLLVMISPVIIWTLYGIWFGFSIRSLIFGLLIGLMILFENLIYKNKKIKVNYFRRIIIFLILLPIFALLLPAENNYFYAFIKAMAAVDVPLWNNIASYYLKEYLLTFILSILLAVNVHKNYTYIIHKNETAEKIYNKILPPFQAVLFIFSLGLLISSGGSSDIPILL